MGNITVQFNNSGQVKSCITAIRTEYKKAFPASKQTPFKLEIDERLKEPIPDRG